MHPESTLRLPGDVHQSVHHASQAGDWALVAPATVPPLCAAALRCRPYMVDVVALCEAVVMNARAEGKLPEGLLRSMPSASPS